MRKEKWAKPRERWFSLEEALEYCYPRKALTELAGEVERRFPVGAVRSGEVDTATLQKRVLRKRRPPDKYWAQPLKNARSHQLGLPAWEGTGLATSWQAKLYSPTASAS